MALTAQTGSRLANTFGGWLGICNIDVVNWTKTNEFEVASYALSDSVNPNSDFKLQWRRAGGSFADVGADTEICWGTGTSLVDGNAVANPAGCYSTVDDDIESEGDNLAHLDNIKNGDYCEIQWALGFGSGALDGQEYELQLVVIDWSNQAVLQTSITTLASSSSSSKSSSSSSSSSESSSSSKSSSSSSSKSSSSSSQA